MGSDHHASGTTTPVAAASGSASAGDGPRLSVVIPAFNEEVLLPRTLEALRGASEALRARGWEWELIVCDNNSSDRTGEIARDHGARVVHEPVNQIGRARNTGAAAARGEWLLFLDADSVPTRELLGAAVDRIRRGDVLYAGTTVRFDEVVPWWGRALLGAWNLLSRGLRWMAGSFILVEAAAFREVGGFNLALYAGEELDLTRRLKRLARRRGRRGVILEEGLQSSARRMNPRDRRAVLRFVLRALVRPWATTQSREACAMWYQGRAPRTDGLPADR